MDNITQKIDKVPVKQKIAYALGGPVDIWAVWILVSIAYPLFNMELKMSPTQIAIILMSLRVWDGIADPLMGWISDNTRTRWGRRRPFVLVGAILAGITFPLMFWFPREFSDGQIMVWVIGFGILFYSCFTVWAMPYQSMLMEMTPDYNERTSAASYRGYLQAISSIVVAFCWKLALSQKFALADGTLSTQNGMRYISIYIGIAIIILGIIPAFFVHERYYEHHLTDKQKKSNLFKSLRKTFSNKPFVIICLFSMFFLIGTNIFDSYGRYVGTYYVLGGDWVKSADFAIYGALIYTACSLCLIPFYLWLSKIIGKDKCLLISVILLIISALLTWFTFTPNNPWLMLVNPLLIGAGYAGIWLMIPSMNADIVDHDELKTGERREGSFASIYSWVLKFSFSLGFMLAGPLLELTGFDAKLNSDQSTEVIFNLRLYFVLIPVVALIIATILLKNFSITQKEAGRIRAELEKRRGKI